MLGSMTARLPGLCAVALLLAVVACTKDSSEPSIDPPTPSASSAAPASTQGQTTLTRQDAKLQLRIEQLRGGIKPKQRPALKRSMGKPVASWIEGAYGGSYPRSSYAKAFRGWTKDAAKLARRDRDTTTNAAHGHDLTAMVFDRRVVRFYVFASKGLTGGATAKVTVRFTGEHKDGSAKTTRIVGNLYLTRDGGHWHVFGYDLARKEVRR